MRTSSVLVAALSLVLLSLSACNQVSAPPDTRAADEKAIRDLEAQWQANYRAKDTEKLVTDYSAADASYLDPGKPIHSGKDEVLKAFREELADPNSAPGASLINKLEVSRSGDLAYLQGAYSETHTDPKTNIGNYVMWTLHCEWRAHQANFVGDLYNQDQRQIDVGGSYSNLGEYVTK